MPLLPGKENIGRNIRTEEQAGKPAKQATAIALHNEDPKEAGKKPMDHKSAIAKMHPEHLHKLVQDAHAGKFGAQAQQTAQQAMQGQGSDNSGSQPQQDDQPGSGRDYVGMFGAGGEEDDQAAPAPRPSMFARAGGQ